jgi:hypothetical protein
MPQAYQNIQGMFCAKRSALPEYLLEYDKEILDTIRSISFSF